MTREEKETIFNQLSELEEQHPAFSESVRDNAYCEAIADVKRIIERINEPSLPSNLDEAAEKNFETMEVLEHENIFEETHHKIFKAGAEWMAGHGVAKEAVVGMATEVVSINFSPQTLDELDLCPGDKVVVQIRKKQ